MARLRRGPASLRRPLQAAVLCAALGGIAGAPAFAAPGADGAGFLALPSGGRPAALGGAYSALANDAYAPIWNPAGLGFTRGEQLAVGHESDLKSANAELGSFAAALPGGQGLGVAAQRGRLGGSFASYALSYGRAVSPALALGASAKLIEAAVAGAPARGAAVDLGSFYRADERLTAAFVVANAGSRLRSSAGDRPMPTQARAGATYWPLPGRANFSLEGVYGPQRAVGFRAGGEVRAFQILALRAGLDTTSPAAGEGASVGGFTAGLGLDLLGAQVAYAFAPRGELGKTQSLSLLVRFGAARETPDAARAPVPAALSAPARREAFEGSEEPKHPSLLWLSQ